MFFLLISFQRLNTENYEQYLHETLAATNFTFIYQVTKISIWIFSLSFYLSVVSLQQNCILFLSVAFRSAFATSKWRMKEILIAWNSSTYLYELATWFPKIQTDKAICLWNAAEVGFRPGVMKPGPNSCFPCCLVWQAVSAEPFPRAQLWNEVQWNIPWEFYPDVKRISAFLKTDFKLSCLAWKGQIRRSDIFA